MDTTDKSNSGQPLPTEYEDLQRRHEEALIEIAGLKSRILELESEHKVQLDAFYKKSHNMLDTISKTRQALEVITSHLRKYDH